MFKNIAIAIAIAFLASGAAIAQQINPSPPLPPNVIQLSPGPIVGASGVSTPVIALPPSKPITHFRPAASSPRW